MLPFKTTNDLLKHNLLKNYSHKFLTYKIKDPRGKDSSILLKTAIYLKPEADFMVNVNISIEKPN